MRLFVCGSRLGLYPLAQVSPHLSQIVLEMAADDFGVVIVQDVLAAVVEDVPQQASLGVAACHAHLVGVCGAGHVH